MYGAADNPSARAEMEFFGATSTAIAAEDVFQLAVIACHYSTRMGPQSAHRGFPQCIK